MDVSRQEMLQIPQMIWPMSSAMRTFATQHIACSRGNFGNPNCCVVNSSISVAYFTICCWLNPNFRWDKSFNPILRWSKKLVRQNYNVLGKLWFHMSIHQEIEWILWICLMGVPIPLVHHFPIRSLAISIGYIMNRPRIITRPEAFLRPTGPAKKIRLVRWWFFEVWANCFAAGYVDWITTGPQLPTQLDWIIPCGFYCQLACAKIYCHPFDVLTEC